MSTCHVSVCVSSYTPGLRAGRVTHVDDPVRAAAGRRLDQLRYGERQFLWKTGKCPLAHSQACLLWVYQYQGVNVEQCHFITNHILTHNLTQSHTDSATTTSPNRNIWCARTHTHLCALHVLRDLLITCGWQICRGLLEKEETVSSSLVRGDPVSLIRGFSGSSYSQSLVVLPS